ncbi:NLI interacting factor phosphatase [uncultured virus]|nr:NLI interacting factor phosphatase [uncultured virus]
MTSSSDNDNNLATKSRLAGFKNKIPPFNLADSSNPDTIRYDCVVLDLDGSLVYSSDENEGDGLCIKYIDSDGEPSEIWVHKRPGFDEFLVKCFEKATVGVWSMGQPGYVEAVVALFPQRPLFVYNWCNCDRSPGRIFKRLNNIPYIGNIVMVDDCPDILEESERVDTLIIPEWSPDELDDRALYEIMCKLF